MNKCEDDSSDRPLCVICHRPIDLSNFGQKEIILEQHYVGCPNGHLVHSDCLKQWISQSKSCPLCHEKYELHIIKIFSNYLKQVEEDQKRLLEEKKKQDDLKREEEKTKHEFDSETLKKFNRGLILFDNGNYEAAINIYWDIIDEKNYPQKDPRYLQLLFQLGRSYYKMSKPALGIRQLMKLVKLDFNFPLGFYYLGLCYESIGVPAKAKWAYDRSLRNLKILVEEDPNYQSFIENVSQRIEIVSTS